MSSTTRNPALHGNPFSSFLRYAIPSVLGILAMSTASVIDGIFIGRYEGSEALAAINLIIPVLSVTFGVSYMLAVGSSVTAGKYVGEGNISAANHIFSKALIANIIYGLLLLAAGLLGSQLLFRALGAEPELFSPMQDYFGTLVFFLPLQVATALYYFFVRIAGYPSLSSIALVIGSLTNLLLDWWLIGIRGEGLVGAALATGISNLVTLSILLSYRFKTNAWLRFIPRQKNWRELYQACFNGLSEFINEISAGVVTFILNLVIINKLGVAGVAAFSVVSYSLFVGLLLSFSIADALQAVCSQCFGARDKQRLNQFVTIAFALISISATGFIALLLNNGEAMVQLFISDNTDNLTHIALGFIAVLWPVFLFNGLNVMLSAYLTATHHAKSSAAIALLRSLVLPLTLLAVITLAFPEAPFMLAITGAEALTLVIALLLFYRFRPNRLLAT